MVFFPKNESNISTEGMPKSDSVSAKSSKSTFFQKIKRSTSSSTKISAEKVNSANPFSKMKAWMNDKAEGLSLIDREVQWKERGKVINIKISALSEQIGISKPIILEYAKNEKLMDLKKDAHQLKELERLSKTYNLPILELYKAQENGSLDDYLLNSIKKINWKNDQGKQTSTTISMLEQQLGIPDQEILKFVKNEELSKLKELALYSKTLNIPLPIILDYVKNEGLNKLKELETLAKKFDLPLIDLISKSSKKYDPSAKNEKLANQIKETSKLDFYLLEAIKEIEWPNDVGKGSTSTTISALAEQLGIPPLEVLKYVKTGELYELKDLERVSKKFELPFHEVLSHSKSENLQEYLFNAQAEKIALEDQEWAEEVDKKCQIINEKLDILASEGKLISQGADGQISSLDLESVKKVVKNAYMVFGKAPPKEEHIFYDITKKHRIMVKSSGDSIAITGLFGKLLGAGAFGAAIQTIDLSKGEWVTGDEAVLKVATPQIEKSEKDEIAQEYTLIKKIHGDTQVLGIQKQLKIIRNVLTGEVSYSHLGPRYQKDLKNILPENIEDTEKLNQADQISLTYQLLYGVSHMHSKSITHGDIKPGNIFCDLDRTDEETGPLLYLGDFGGGIDHSAKDPILQKTVTPQFRINHDNEAAEKAYLAGDKALYMEIEKKADVFATCSVIYSLFTNEQPYQLENEEIGSIKPDIQKMLAKSGLSQNTIDLITRGLSFDYNQRPNAEDILTAVQADLNDPSKVPSERSAFLSGQTLLENEQFQAQRTRR